METVTSKDGTSIAFDRSGSGPPLILVGGALTDRNVTGTLAAQLDHRNAVYAYDRRGRGDNGDTPPYAVEREVEDISALIGEAGGSAFAFGHSSGAALALEAARSLAITKLALYEPPFIVDGTRPPVPEDYVSHLNELVSEDRRGDAVAYFMTAGVGPPAETVDQMRSSPMWSGMEALAHTIPYDGEVMGDLLAGRALPRDRWTSVTIPTLVMDGGASPAWAGNAARALVEVLPNARRRTLEGQDHGPPPEVVAPVLDRFFSDEGGGDGR